MGQEISDSQFSESDFTEFQVVLAGETEQIDGWFRDQLFSARDRVGGFELEAWLIDSVGHPAPVNDVFLDRLDDPLVVPELARFNVELNTHPEQLQGAALYRMQQRLESTWSRCCEMAQQLDANMLMIGILPTLAVEDLTARNMSPLQRYKALNEQVLRQRDGKPLELDIVGREHMKMTHSDVMLESATTSFQIHLKVSQACAVKYYNLSQILSAPMVAVSANSPYLFGKDLWAETRIPLFEQSVEVGGVGGAAHGPMRRVSFGTGFLQHSLVECFHENLAHYPALLPMKFDTAEETLPHLRLHNGTIWRWNRPLLGFDDDGTPHLRIEHRVVPGGPSIVDVIANAAFYFGLVRYFGERNEPLDQRLAFADVRDNFYSAARDGLDASINWLDGWRGRVHVLLQDVLLPAAREGLHQLDIDDADIDRYLGVIEGRLQTGRNGAAWQRAWVEKHGADMPALVAAYLERQISGLPVHEWRL